MTDTLQDVVLTRPAPAPTPGPLDDGFLDLVEARFRRIVADNPLRRRRSSASTPRIAASATARATRSSARSPTRRPTWRRSRRSIRRACRPRPARARARDPQPAPGAVRHRGASGLGATLDRDRRRRRRAVRDLRAGLRAAAGPTRRDRQPAGGRSARTSTSTAPAPPSPRSGRWQELELESAADLPSLFNEIVAAGADLPDVDRRRLTARATPRGRPSRTTARGSGDPRDAASTTGRSGASTTTS